MAAEFKPETLVPGEQADLKFTITDLQQPRGVAVNEKGQIVVTDCHDNCVSIFSGSGEKVRSSATKAQVLVSSMVHMVWPSLPQETFWCVTGTTTAFSSSLPRASH